jgi:hypothetical protein
MHWSDDECIQVSVEKPWERDHQEDLDVTGRPILKHINLAQNRDQWQVIVNMVMNLP